MKKPKCKNCYDKGFFSELSGGTKSLSDFGGYHYYKSGVEMKLNFCDCAFGKKLKVAYREINKLTNLSF